MKLQTFIKSTAMELSEFDIEHITFELQLDSKGDVAQFETGNKVVFTVERVDNLSA